MKVNLYQVTLTIEGKERRLTKAIANQFPIGPTDVRMLPARHVKEPICKVRGKVLGHIAAWLYLVEDDVAGLVWEPAMLYSEPYAAQMRETGTNVDDPSGVPTVIL